MKKPILNGVLISAGFSSRMGDFKPLILYNQKPFIVEIIQKLFSVCDKIIIVTGFKCSEVESVIKNEFEEDIFHSKIHLVLNPEYEIGMFSSLQTGIKNTFDADWVLYHFIDQPLLPVGFYKEFVKQIDENFDWIQPVYNLEHGHPVILNRSLFEKIVSLPYEANLRIVKEADSTKKKLWECSYPHILTNINSKSDLDKINS